MQISLGTLPQALVPSPDTLEVFLRLAVATFVGGAIGLNRDFRGKPAGLRTHALVGLGASLVTIISTDFAMASGTLNSDAVSRVLQGVITGIGFLGGGVILRDPERRFVHGLTTAASVWVVAALGIACGAGRWATALIALLLTLAVLILGGPSERILRRLLLSRERSDEIERRSRGERRRGDG